MQVASRLLAVVVTAVLSFASYPALAAQWYVAASGNDLSGDGSFGKPFRTVSRALVSAVDGDEVRVLPGTYRECFDTVGRAIAIVADAITRGGKPSDTVIDGAGACGGRFCDASDRLGCLAPSDCVGACVVVRGKGTCSNDSSVSCSVDTCDTTAMTCRAHPSVACSADSDCRNLDCDFGSCVPIRVCAETPDTWCGDDSDCPDGVTCTELVPGPVARLGSGSRVAGLALRHGRASGVLAYGSVAIETSEVTENEGPGGAGGIEVVSLASPLDGGLCLEVPAISCATASDCRVCSGDGRTPCASDADCADVGGTCGPETPCLPGRRVSISDTVVRDNGGDGARGGGGIRVAASAEAGSAMHVELLGNTVEDNSASSATSSGGGILVEAEGSGISRVRVDGGTVARNRAASAGGGMALHLSTEAGADASASVAGVTFDRNSATEAGRSSRGGGLHVLARGAGVERVEVSRCGVRGNETGGDGGGISAELDPSGPVGSSIALADNRVGGNTALGGGGGMALAVDASIAGTEARIEASGNEVSGNSASGPGGGGGLLVRAVAAGNAAGSASARLSENSIRGNFAAHAGGGVRLGATAESSPGPAAPASASIVFDHNLVASNGPAGPKEGLDTYATGVLAELSATGSASASAELDFLTVSANRSAKGTAGIEFAVSTAYDESGTEAGTASAALRNSIVSDNVGVGVEAIESPGPGAISLTVAHNAVHGNVRQAGPLDWGDEIGDRTGTSGNVSIDPGLGSGFLPGSCSASLDLADPAAPFADEPQPNGGRANLGFTGGTASAASTLADPSGDRKVDGRDLVWLDSAFGSVASDPARYLRSADFNLDGRVDGEDLAYLAASFGVVCP